MSEIEVYNRDGERISVDIAKELLKNTPAAKPQLCGTTYWGWRIATLSLTIIAAVFFAILTFYVSHGPILAVLTGVGMLFSVPTSLFLLSRFAHRNYDIARFD